ncbi:MAG: hypothetical protein SFX18_16900 [Pirellulales bacterium]|nr:hypothetical protein [Pirellulales bacterium]
MQRILSLLGLAVVAAGLSGCSACDGLTSDCGPGMGGMRWGLFNKHGMHNDCSPCSATVPANNCPCGDSAAISGPALGGSIGGAELASSNCACSTGGGAELIGGAPAMVDSLPPAPSGTRSRVMPGIE